jgi:predicted DNA-binding ribbon-helix-helix protein
MNALLITAGQRKAAYRARLRAGGLQSITVAVEASTASWLKEMARQRDCTLGEVIDLAVHAADAAERKAKYRAKTAAVGRRIVSLSLDAEAASRLRRLAKRDDCPQATVIAAALALVDNPQLVRDVQAWADERAAKAAGGLA